MKVKGSEEGAAENRLQKSAQAFHQGSGSMLSCPCVGQDSARPKKEQL